MTVPRWIAAVTGLLVVSAGAHSSFAEQIQVQTATSFTCSSNSECKRKCEALGSDHTWKPNPGGSTFGTCTKRGRALPLSEQIHALQAQLFEAKILRARDDARQDYRTVMELKPSECDALGGDVDYDSLPGCSLNLTCTTTTVGPSGEIEMSIVCIDEFDSTP